jgi:hypothetical protein
VTTDPPDHPTGAKLGTADPKNRGLPASAHHQILVSTEQETNLQEITTERKHGIRKKVFLHQGKNLIQADRGRVMHLCVVHRAAVHSRTEAQKAGQKEPPTAIGVENNLVKRNAILQEGRCLTQGSQLLATDPKEAPIGVEVNHLKGNLLANQALKAVKGLQAENSAAVHQKILDISHFVNRPIHLIINHRSEQNGAQKINRYAPGKNLQKKQV